MQKVKIFFSAFLVLILFVSISPLSAFASNAISPITFPFSEPYVSNTTAYIAVNLENISNGSEFAYIVCLQCSPVNQSYEYEGDSPVFIIDDIYDNKIELSINGNDYTTYNFSCYILSQSGKINTLSTTSFSDNLNGYLISFSSAYRIFEVDFHGNFNLSSLGSNFNTFAYLFTEDRYEYIYLLSIYNVLVGYGELQEDELEKLDTIISNSSDIESAIQDIKTSFGSKLDTIISDNVVFKQRLEELLDYLQSIDSNTDEVESWLNTIYTDFVDIYFLIEGEILQILDAVDELEGYTDEIESLLREILEYLQPDTDVNVSKVDPSNFNEYNKAEQSLLDNSNIDVTGAMNVEINQQALTFIWPLVERCLNTNPKVIGLTFTILAVSLVALILGRKGG